MSLPILLASQIEAAKIGRIHLRFSKGSNKTHMFHQRLQRKENEFLCPHTAQQWNNGSPRTATLTLFRARQLQFSSNPFSPEGCHKPKAPQSSDDAMLNTNTPPRNQNKQHVVGKGHCSLLPETPPRATPSSPSCKVWLSLLVVASHTRAVTSSPRTSHSLGMFRFLAGTQRTAESC